MGYELYLGKRRIVIVIGYVSVGADISKVTAHERIQYIRLRFINHLFYPAW
jgi:hypothetical protein